MPQYPIGCDKSQLDTPLLCIDLDKMESNIDRMAGYCREHGVHWRPHSKCHKTPAIAWREVRAGALGVTCAKLSEAEVMAAGGIRDILVANMVAGERKLERVAALCHWADPIIAVDHYAQVEPLAAICHKRGVEPRVIVEVDIGLSRVGVSPGKPAVELGQAIDRLKGVRLAGVMGYEGHLLKVADPEEKERSIFHSIAALTHTADMFRSTGLSCEIVSAGGTGSYQITARCPGVTELQAGGGICMDPYYREDCHVEGLDYALTVMATVVSRPLLERAVLDCGRKTMNPDVHVPVVVGLPDAKVQRLSAEHCELTLGPQSQDLKIGDRVELVVGYGDFTTVLHDEFYGFRGDRLEVVWPILGRGKLQ
ncbi:MAG TPA: DSD1 family PLP-dependent enzyme [Planctomycetaceae bacterium]|nr:DSD1 family PLP-dependent enzyme [Planctomycetaceae bacterium]